MHARLTIAASLVLPALLALALGAAAAGAGTISGQVVARSAGAAAVGPTDVVLHAFAKATGGELGAAATARTDATGRFSFTGIETGADRGYVVTVDHRGVRYSSELIVFPTGETAVTADVEVYEPTEASDWIWLRQQHLIVTPDLRGGTLAVVEIAIVENGGDRTFVGTQTGGGIESVRLPLPAQAYDVDMGGQLARNAAIVPGAIVYTGPLLPGQTELVLGYSVRFTGGYTLPKVLPLDADAVDVLIADVGVTARSAQLSGPTPVEASGKKFLRFSGRGIGAGTVVSVQIAPAAPAGSPGSPQDALAPIGLVALVGTTGYLLVAPRLRRSRAVARSRKPDRQPAPARRDETDEDELLLEDER